MNHITDPTARHAKIERPTINGRGIIVPDVAVTTGWFLAVPADLDLPVCSDLVVEPSLVAIRERC
jgi:hypothetical protein